VNFEVRSPLALVDSFEPVAVLLEFAEAASPDIAAKPNPHSLYEAEHSLNEQAELRLEHGLQDRAEDENQIQTILSHR
jgi:hypothetical protein